MGKWVHRIIERTDFEVNCSNCGWVPIKWVFDNNRRMKPRCSISIAEHKGQPNKNPRNRFHGLTKIETVEFKNDKVCEICGTDKKLVVDHNHASKALRGVLCHNCNVGIGFFGDSIDKLQAAIEYLKRHA